MTINKLIKLIPIVLISLLANKSYGMDVMFSVSYWQYCWLNVNAKDFTGSAREDIEDIQVVHNQDYHIPLINQENENTSERIKIYANSTAAITSAMTSGYAALSEMKSTIQKSLLREKLNFLGQITQDGINENHYGLFVDHNGADGNINANAPSFSYYKNLCRRNKMFSEAFSTEARVGKSLRLSSIVNDQREHTLSSNSQISLATIKNDLIYDNFCAEEDILNGLCKNTNIILCDSESGVCNNGKEVLSNALVSSEYLLNPKGDPEKNSIKGELFKTENTYSDDEELAARAFAFNVVYSNAIPAPTNYEKKNADNSKFVAMYSQYIASLDLASYSFNNAIESRSVISDGDLQLSKRDVLKYIHTNLKNPDNIAIASSGKDKAMEVYMFTAQSLKNKIDLDRIEQNERIELLLAAILTKIANKNDNIKYNEYFAK